MLEAGAEADLGAISFPQIYTQNSDLNRIQNNISNTLSGITTATGIAVTNLSGQIVQAKTGIQSPFINGNVINITLTAGQDNLVPHGLGITPKAWVVIQLGVQSNIWSPVSVAIISNSGTAASANDNYLNLWCSANCNISVWVS